MEKVRPPRWVGWPLKPPGDKGYSYPAVRSWLARRGIEQVIPQRSDQVRYEGKRKFDRRTYKRRARVEQSVGWLKESRRVGTRYDKLASIRTSDWQIARLKRWEREGGMCPALSNALTPAARSLLSHY